MWAKCICDMPGGERTPPGTAPTQPTKSRKAQDSEPDRTGFECPRAVPLAARTSPSLSAEMGATLGWLVMAVRLAERHGHVLRARRCPKHRRRGSPFVTTTYPLTPTHQETRFPGG